MKGRPAGAFRSRLGASVTWCLSIYVSGYAFCLGLSVPYTGML